MWNLKYDANEPTCEIQTDHKHRNQTCGCQWGGSWGRDKLGVWDSQMPTSIYRKEKQLSPTV